MYINRYDPKYCSYQPACFFITDTATTDIYTLSLHDALPIYDVRKNRGSHRDGRPGDRYGTRCADGDRPAGHQDDRSEEHTSELQSRPHLVCRLLLEKKKKISRSTASILQNCIICNSINKNHF